MEGERRKAVAWMVGREFRGGGSAILGVFSSEGRAVMACRRREDFVLPIVVDRDYALDPSNPDCAPRSYYPLSGRTTEGVH